MPPILILQPLPDQLVIVQEHRMVNGRERGLEQIHKTLDSQICTLVQREEMDTIEHIQNIALAKLQCQQVLKDEMVTVK